MSAREGNSSTWFSLAGATAFGVALAMLSVLETTHQKSEVLAAGDNERVGKLIVSVLLAVVASTVAIVCAIRPVCSGNWRPLIWLGGAGLGWIVLGAIVLGALRDL